MILKRNKCIYTKKMVRILSQEELDELTQEQLVDYREKIRLHYEKLEEDMRNERS